MNKHKRYENEMALITKAVQIGLDEMYKQEIGQTLERCSGHNLQHGDINNSTIPG